MPRGTIVDLDRLKANLLTSGIQQKNNALYQVINQLIDSQININNLFNTFVTGPGTGGTTNIINQNFLSSILNLDGFSSDSEFVIPGPPGIGVQGLRGFPGLQGEDGLDGSDSIIPGPPGPAGSASANAEEIITGTLTDAQSKTLASVPRVVVPASGAGIINIIKVAIWHPVSIGGYNTSANITLRYVGSGLVVSTTVTGLFNIAINRYIQMLGISAAIADPQTGAENKDIEVFAAGDLTAGNAANTLAYHIRYNKVPIF